MVCSDVSLDELVGFHVGIDAFGYANLGILYQAEFPVGAVYCIRAGAVKLMKSTPSGEHRILRVLKTGDVAGLESAFAETYEHTAVAIGKVQACRIPITHFRRFVAGYPDLQVRLLQKSAAALREAETWYSAMLGSGTPARVRVARLLLRLRAGSSDRIHRLSLDDMAAMAGITRETVSRAISEFIRMGILVKSGSGMNTRHFRGDMPALEKIAQPD